MKKTLVIIFIFTILIVLMEWGARFYVKSQNSKSTGMNLEGKTYGVMRYDEELGFTHTANAYNLTRSTNNMGFLNTRDVSLPKKRNSQNVVFVAYGGSTTYCYNLKQNEAWPNLFQQELCNSIKNNNQPCKYSVFNAGHIMYSIGHAYKRAQRDLPILKPNYIIIYSGINEYANYNFLKSQNKIDFEKSIKNKEYGLIAKYDYWYLKHNLVIKKIIHYKLIVPLQNYLRYLTTSESLIVFKKADKKKINKPEDYINLADEESPIVYENYLGTLEKFINLAKKHDSKIIFLAQSQGLNLKHNILFTSLSQKAKKKISELGAIVIDSSEIFEMYEGDKKDLYHETGVHYSLEGSKLVAKLLSSRFK